MLLTPDELRELPSGDPPDEPGIYFLWADDALLYIGLSMRLCDRLHRHARIRDGFLGGKEIPFTRHTFMEIPLGKFLTDWPLRKVESAYIRAYLPPFNQQIR